VLLESGDEDANLFLFDPFPFLPIPWLFLPLTWLSGHSHESRWSSVISLPDYHQICWLYNPRIPQATISPITFS